MGHPINHSTHSGFNWPPSEAITAWSIRSFDRSFPLLRVRAAGDDPLDALAHGVGHNPFRAINPSVGRSLAPELALLFIRPPPESIAHGVGNMRADSASIKVPPSRPFVGVTRPPLSARLAVGVGQNPDALAEMVGATIGRR
jgi:hypothetical protein